MGFINVAEKTISAKLVYYGVGMGGKTTSLKAVHEIMCPANEVKLVSINTEEDSTLLFDFLPMDLGTIEGFKIRIQGFTVPGQPKYRRMRKYVLSGADAVVMVIDSQTSRLEENLQSLENLIENLKLNGLDPETIPIVLQYNKRDLGDVLPESELDQHFKIRPDIASFPSVGTEAAGVFETFVHAAGLLVADKVRLYGLGRGSLEPEAVAKASQERLWEIADAQLLDESPTVDSEKESIRLRFDAEGHRTEGDRKQPLDADDEAPTLTEADLDIDLDIAEPAADLFKPEPGLSLDDLEDPGLLDVAVESQLEMTERLGELDHYKTMLERKNRELVRVSQNVVHDLKRPLSAIQLMLSSMRKGILGEIDERMSTAVDTGLTAIKQMERLIGDLIDSTRLDFDGVQLNFEHVDVALLASEVVRNLRYEIEESGVGVRIEPMPTIEADPWALQKALTNLIGNSIQYAAPDRAPRVWVSCEDQNGRWVIIVRDNGIGVPAEDLPRMFQRFERGRNAGGISGTGLGLHIVKEVVLGHGGSVWVESEEDVGTSFHLAIPKEPVQPPHSTVSDTSAWTSEKPLENSGPRG